MPRGRGPRGREGREGRTKGPGVSPALPAPRRLLFSFLVALVLPLLAEESARAFCRTSVCKAEGASSHGKLCTPSEIDDCGVAVQWRQPCIGFALQKDGSKDVPAKDVHATVVKAFAAWRSVQCAKGKPSVEVLDLGTATCDRTEYNQHGGNANIVVFRDQVWPHQDAESDGTTDTIALTTVTYDVEKGDIFDADIEVNEVQNHFTTTDVLANVDVDLLSVLTHEAGHFLGLAHSSVGGATMFPSYDNGTITLRDLAEDDKAAICAAYPPARKATGTCDGLPRHGFSPDCDGEQLEGRCSLSAGAAPASSSGPAALSLIALALLARRRSALRARSGSPSR